MTTGIYRKEPLFLAVCSEEPISFERLKRDLREFFSIPNDELVSLETDRLGAFYTPGYFEPLAGSFLNQQGEDAMTVSSHSIYEEECIQKPEHGLTRFFGRVHSGKADIADFPAPLAIFQVKKPSESVVCYNDSFGAGRIYYAREKNFTVVSNSIPAAALARRRQCESNEDFWAPYYCGGAVGEATFIRGISLVPAGSRLVIKPGTFSLRSTPLGTQLKQQINEPVKATGTLETLLSPLRALSQLIELPRPIVGLSGGRDSRLVAALTLNAGMAAQYQTWFPPKLETEIAAELVGALSQDVDWVSIDRSELKTDSPVGDLRSRTRDWFTFTGGDHWSTFIRRAAPPKNTTSQTVPDYSISGLGGEVTRGSLYLKSEAAAGDAEPALRRYIDRSLKYWPLISRDIRERSRILYQEALLESFVEGFNGFHALDLTEMNTNYRRMIPPPNPGIVAPLFSLSLARAAFGASPLERIRSQPLREITEMLVPEWIGKPYYHEVAATRNDPKDNKVTIQPTHWEVDRADFLESMEAALAVTEFANLTMGEVEKEIESPSDGRNRTNILFETILWHGAATEQVIDINRILRRP